MDFSACPETRFFSPDGWEDDDPNIEYLDISTLLDLTKLVDNSGDHHHQDQDHMQAHKKSQESDKPWLSKRVRLQRPYFEPPSKPAPEEVLIKQQVKVLFNDIENMMTLFVHISPSDPLARLLRFQRRFRMYLARLDMILQYVWLPRPKLKQARYYRRTFGGMVLALEALMGIDDPNDPEASDIFNDHCDNIYNGSRKRRKIMNQEAEEVEEKSKQVLKAKEMKSEEQKQQFELEYKKLKLRQQELEQKRILANLKTEVEDDDSNDVPMMDVSDDFDRDCGKICHQFKL